MNKVYFNDFFNKEQKDRYLKSLSTESTRKSYATILRKTAIMESSLNKDLYDFNLQEISQFLFTLKATKISSLRHAGSVARNYIQWAIEQDLRKDNINPLIAITTHEWYSQFVDDSSLMLFTEKQIDNIVDSLINAQDQAVVQGVFEGISGTVMSELANMKMEHISKTNIKDKYKIKLFNDSPDGVTSREILISSNLYEILKSANKEDKYLKNNGLVSESIKSRYNVLVDNGYILKTAVHLRAAATNSNQDDGRPTQGQILGRRIKKAGEFNNFPMLTAINLRNSGMLKMARDLHRERGRLGTEEYYDICEHYDVGKKEDGTFNIDVIRRNFLNIDTINKLYGTEE